MQETYDQVINGAGEPITAAPAAGASLLDTLKRLAAYATAGPRAAVGTVQGLAGTAVDAARRGAFALGGMEPAEPHKYGDRGFSTLSQATGDIDSEFSSIRDSYRKMLADAGGREIQQQGIGALPPALPKAPTKPVARPVAAAPVVAPAAAPAFAPRAGGVARGALEEPPSEAAPQEAAPATGALAAPLAQPPAPAPSLAEQYAAKTAAIDKKVKGDLTPEQKKRLELGFWMAMLSGSSKDGARALGAFGDAGQGTLKQADAYEATNRALSGTEITQARDDAFKATGFGEKDADRAERVTHNAMTEKARQDQLALLKQQIELGKWHVINNAKTGTVVLYDTKSGQSKDTGIKYDKTDSRPAEIRLLEYLQSNPKAMETALTMKGREGGLSEGEQFKAAMGLLKGDMTGKMTAADAAQRARDVAGAISGKGRSEVGSGVTVSRKSAPYQQALKDPRINGDAKKLDEAITKSGRTVTD